MLKFLFALSSFGVAAAELRESCESNPIVAENSLTGTPSNQWDINGAGCHEVQGFATRASVLPDSTITFKIKMSYEEPLRVDVYRLGYYSGDGARKHGVANLVRDAVKLAVSQPDCLIPEPEAALWDCGNWHATATWKVPSNATSGYYFARATLPGPDPQSRWREDASRINYDPHHAIEGADPKLPPMSGKHAYGSLGRNKLRNALTEPRASHIFFVVRDRAVRDAGASSADAKRGLLFQTAEQTSHAYNGYGGLTTYGSFEYPFEHAPLRRPMDITVPGHDLKRAYKRSYNTPMITRDYRSVEPSQSIQPALDLFLDRCLATCTNHHGPAT